MTIAIQRIGTAQNAGDREEDFLFVCLIVFSEEEFLFLFFSHTESRMLLWSGGEVAIMGKGGRREGRHFMGGRNLVLW